MAQGRTEVEDELNGYRALHWAARMGHADVVGELLRLGAHHSARDRSGSTALHVAACHGHTAVMKTLLAQGADRDALNNARDTLPSPPPH